MTIKIDLTRFDAFEIHGCLYVHNEKLDDLTVEQCDDKDAEFFSLYGHFSVESGEHGVESILDFPTRPQAEHAAAMFEGFRTLQLDAKGACKRFNEVCDDGDMTCVTHVIDAMMEHMHALQWG